MKVDISKNFESPLTKYSGKKTVLKMESATYEAMQRILKKKSDKVHEEFSKAAEIPKECICRQNVDRFRNNEPTKCTPNNLFII